MTARRILAALLAGLVMICTGAGAEPAGPMTQRETETAAGAPGESETAAGAPGEVPAAGATGRSAFIVRETEGEAEISRDITALCTLTAGAKGATLKRCLDRNYKTYWRSVNGAKAWIEVSVPEGETAGGVSVQWHEHPHAWSLQTADGTGKWETVGLTEGRYLAEWLELPEGTTRFRVANAPGERRHFNLTEIRIWSAGETPKEVQRWRPPAEKADLMLLVTHSDDEVLWFGGTLPTYAGERDKVCQVCMLVPGGGFRRLELLDSLWTCGVKNYPVWGGMSDAYTDSLRKQYGRWSRERVNNLVTGWIRRFRPDVLITHDVNGEYGHGGHQVCADAAMQSVELASSIQKFPRTAKEYGTWDVKKCYLHLWEENPVEMDWDQPLNAFGGKTSLEVAREAFRCHTSQQRTHYRVRDEGPNSCRLFGLYRSLVGPDEAGNDFFEHLE